MSDPMLPLAPDGVFRTVNGEGYFLGLSQVFIRLAGCSVGCAHCDTDYSVGERLTVREITRRAFTIARNWTCPNWAWITGGEPTDHNIGPLIRELHGAGFQVAVATAGVRPLPAGWGEKPCFVSVSPHDPEKWVVREGDQINVVPGLNGHRLKDFKLHEIRFGHRYVTPCHGRPETLQECLDWVAAFPDWRLGIQAHRHWGIP